MHARSSYFGFATTPLSEPRNDRCRRDNSKGKLWFRLVVFLGGETMELPDSCVLMEQERDVVDVVGELSWASTVREFSLSTAPVLETRRSV